MKSKNVSKGQSTHKGAGDNKSSETQTRINLIESNRHIKSINRNDGNIKHFIHIYHWTRVDKQTTKSPQISQRTANKQN